MANKECKWCGRIYEKPFLCSDHRDRGYCSAKCEHEAKDAGKGGCFLTTACVEYAGYDDSCYQLEILRKFRDNYLKQLPNGGELVAEYYKLAPKIIEAINESTEKEVILTDMLEQINEAVSAIKKNENHKALNIYSDMFNSLKILIL